ncbi:MAG: N-formylglutamate deformylase [Thermococcaceae archaeon]|nr:N-formylglutamate deformylase [Thermococcaceae archaeon]
MIRKTYLIPILFVLSVSASLVTADVKTPITPSGTYEKGSYLPDTGYVWIDDAGVIVSSFKWTNPQFGNYLPGTYYEHEFRVEMDPNKDKISYGGHYITNLPDGYVDPDDLGVGGNAKKITGRRWY